MLKQVKIYLRYDGWECYVDNNRYSWDHNDEDLGTEALKVLLTDLGYNVEVIEDV